MIWPGHYRAVAQEHRGDASAINITATTAKALPDGKRADILLGHTTIDNAAARNLDLDVTSSNAMGVTNQELINRAALNHQPARANTILAMTS